MSDDKNKDAAAADESNGDSSAEIEVQVVGSRGAVVNDEPVVIDGGTVDGIEDMGATDKAKFWLAKVVLLASAILMAVSWFIYIAFAIWGISDTPAPCADGNAQNVATCTQLLQIQADKLEASKSIFEFAKSWIPPIITLVLGYYFAKEDKNSS